MITKLQSIDTEKLGTEETIRYGRGHGSLWEDEVEWILPMDWSQNWEKDWEDHLRRERNDEFGGEIAERNRIESHWWDGMES